VASFFIDNANLLRVRLTAVFWFLREKPTMYFIARPDLLRYTAPTMSFVRRLASASVVAPSPVYVRPDFD